MCLKSKHLHIIYVFRRAYGNWWVPFYIKFITILSIITSIFCLLTKRIHFLFYKKSRITVFVFFLLIHPESLNIFWYKRKSEDLTITILQSFGNSLEGYESIWLKDWFRYKIMYFVINIARRRDRWMLRNPVDKLTYFLNNANNAWLLAVLRFH